MVSFQLYKTVPVGLVVCFLTIIAAVAPAWTAEESSGQTGQIVPAHIGATDICPCTFGPLIADAAVPIDKGRFAVQPLVAFGITGGDFTDSWRRVSDGGDFYSLSLPVKFTYGPFNKTEVFLVVPYVHNWARNVSEPGGERSADFGGLGDINLTLKYMFVEETSACPAVTGLFAVDFPTGHHSPLNPGNLGTDDMGSGAYRFTAGFNLSKWLKPFILYANLWYTMATTSTSTAEHLSLGTIQLHTHSRDVLTLNLAAEYPLRGTGPWVALLEFYGQWETGPVFGSKSVDPPAALIGMLPGIEYVYSEKLAFALGVGIDLFGKNTSYNYTPIFSFVYLF